MNDLLKRFDPTKFAPIAESIGRVVLILLGAWLLSKFLQKRLPLGRISAAHQFVIRRLIAYTIAVLAVVMVLRQLDVELSVLLGAAGVLTVAIGFAAQTSASNLISGLFLMAESPFAVADTIRVGDTTGEVLSIDLLSVRLRTFDNLLVRIPNETMLKSNVVNLTHFPIRRYDHRLLVGRNTDLAQLEDLLLCVADRNTLCLEEPIPKFIYIKIYKVV